MGEEPAVMLIDAFCERLAGKRRSRGLARGSCLACIHWSGPLVSVLFCFLVHSLLFFLA